MLQENHSLTLYFIGTQIMSAAVLYGFFASLMYASLYDMWFHFDATH
jgi:hypothetical protein